MRIEKQEIVNEGYWMFLYIGKVILLFSISIFVIRFMGKSALAQLTPHDLTAIIFLATMAVNPLLSEDIGRAFIGIFIVVVLHVILSKLALFRWINRMLIGHPTILVKHGKILKSNLDRTHYSLVELLATLRAAGYPDIKDVEYAILEPTGVISIFPFKDLMSITPRHLNLDVEYQGLPISVVIEGKIQHKNLIMIGKNESWLRQQLEAAGHPALHHIFYAAIRDSDHSLSIDTGEGELIT